MVALVVDGDEMGQGNEMQYGTDGQWDGMGWFGCRAMCW